MKIAIRSFMGCERADIEAAPIAIVAGKNAQGKSSICTGVALALANQATPAGVTKDAAGVLVKVGAAKGEVTVTGSEGHTLLTYPKAQVGSEGTPPRASIWAAGLQSIVNLPDRERVEHLRSIIGAEPTAEDFKAAALDAGFAADVIGKMWDAVVRDGWDSSFKKAQDKGRELKAQWDYATGEKYGEKKAESWMPQGWGAGLENSSRDALEAVVTGARAELEAAIAANAVSADRRAELEALAAELPAREKANSEALHASQVASEALAKATKALDEYPQPKQPEAQKCPHCKQPVVVVGGVVSVSNPLTPEALKAMEENRAKKAASVEEARKAAQDASAKHNEAGRLWREAEGAARTLAGMPQAVGTAGEVEVKREAVRNAEADLQAFTKKAEADRLHRAVLANGKAVELLSPDGVRRTVLVKALARFNERMANICGLSSWKPVAVTPDLTVEYGGRPYAPSCSESEQFRARVTLQLAIAQVEGAGAVVIDGADVLDAAGRNGLFNGLRKLAIPAVVGMMANKPENVPAVEKAGCGHAYWINEGIAEVING